MPTQSAEKPRSPETGTLAAQSACRLCGAPLSHVFVDLGSSPLANSYLTAEQVRVSERFYPLKAYVCADCFLVQLEVHESPDRIFADYAYFSSFTDSWVQHARIYSDEVVERFALGADSSIVEIASNDGYLLQHFAAKGIPVLGIEPAANVAAEAERKGIPTRVAFFGEALARELAAGERADLIVANNVLAHVPALNDFVRGIAAMLEPTGVATLEFPHLLRLVAENQFDTIYHEHFSYFSLSTVRRLFAAHGLTIFDVRELSTHGGSLRVYARHAADERRHVLPAVRSLIEHEEAAGVRDLEWYVSFSEKVRETKRRLLDFLIRARREGKSVAGYGAPAKGNTLLNYCGVRCDFIDYTVDRSPYKQGRYLPGTHIPIHPPERVFDTRPDYVLILPWNIREEVMQQMAGVRSWGGRFVVPIPELTVL
jgi:2-polyprenyl-3-methyl-5-hydroxy-6-metoxy-1,4-benzoquinol methylase